MELMATCLEKLMKRLKEPIPECILGKVAVAVSVFLLLSNQMRSKAFILGSAAHNIWSEAKQYTHTHTYTQTHLQDVIRKVTKRCGDDDGLSRRHIIHGVHKLQFTIMRYHFVLPNNFMASVAWLLQLLLNE